MNRLTKEQYDRAVQFLKTQAQDIDRAVFEYFFEGRPLVEVIHILQSYQNEDGGFGRLDYDFECPVSCLKATESACRYLFLLEKIPASHPMIQKLIPYIARNYNQDTGEWNNLTVPEVNSYPHAPWWAHEQNETPVPRSRDELIARYNPNTNSALAGMLVRYSSSVPEDFLEQVMSVVVDKINSHGESDQYGLLSDIFFVNELKDKVLKGQLLKRLMGDGTPLSLLDEEGTERAYKLCIWIDSPGHPCYELYKDAVESNLDFLISSQEEDGSWAPSWSWGEPEVWERVGRRIKGLLTMSFLLALKKFGRIDD